MVKCIKKKGDKDCFLFSCLVIHIHAALSLLPFQLCSLCPWTLSEVSPDDPVCAGSGWNIDDTISRCCGSTESESQHAKECSTACLCIVYAF